MDVDALADGRVGAAAPAGDDDSGFKIPTSDSDSCSELELSDDERRETEQRDELYAAESKLRKRSLITSYEKSTLEEFLKQHYHEGEAELVLATFGKPSGRAMTKQVYSELIRKLRGGYHHGEAFSIILPDWSLAKSLLLSSRNMLQNDPGTPENPDPCYCFPRTAILPVGCYHRAVALGEVPQPSKREPWLCSQCSVCIRCLRNFG